MDFEEFLWAMDREKLSEEIKAHFDEDLAMPDALHDIALQYHQQYMIVGECRQQYLHSLRQEAITMFN